MRSGENSIKYFKYIGNASLAILKQDNQAKIKENS